MPYPSRSGARRASSAAKSADDASAKLPCEQTVIAAPSHTNRNTPALEKKMVDLYIPDPSGSRTLLVPHRGVISKVRVTPTPASLYAEHRKLFPPLKAGEKLGVNKRFWQMLTAVLRIAFPR
jgi:hypothetical protein